MTPTSSTSTRPNPPAASPAPSPLTPSPVSASPASSAPARPDAPQPETSSLRTLHQLLSQLKRGDFQERWTAMKALVKLGDLAIDPLLACLGELEGGPMGDRAGDRQAVPGMAEGVELEAAEIDAIDAARSGKVDGSGAGDRDRSEAFYSEDEDDEDGGWELPWFIAQTLGQIQHPRAVTALVHLVQAYSQPLGGVAPPRSLDVAQVAASALAQLGSTSLPALRALMAHPETRLYGVQALAQMRDPGVVDCLLEAAQDPAVPIRALAFEALSGFFDPRIAPIFAQGLADLSPQVRQRAIVGVGLRSTALDSQWLLQHLSPLLWDLHLGVACQAATALGRMGDPAGVQALGEVVERPTAPALQQAALKSLCRLGTEEAFQSLDRYIQAYLAAPADRPAAPLNDLFVHLGQLDTPSAQRRGLACLTAFLYQTLGQPQHHLLKQSAATSLGQLGRKLMPTVGDRADRQRLLYPLLHLLADPDAGVRFHAIAALKQCDAALAFQCLQAWQEAAPPLPGTAVVQGDGSAVLPHWLPGVEPSFEAALQAGIACALAEWPR
ncbi:MAG: HEAT repeat domain-containing protein [Prochlorothrix sp.]